MAAEAIYDVVGRVVSPHCAETLVRNADFFDVPCIKLLISKLLGFAVVLGSLIVKLPQIIKFVRNKSCEGVSLLSQLQELTAYTISLSYNYTKGFPFSTWGEVFFITVQLVAIVSLMLVYQRRAGFIVVFLAIWAAALYALVFVVEAPLLESIYPLSIPIHSTSRIMQIAVTFMNKSTGQLAFATCLLNFVGSAARIFSVLQEVNDPMVLLSFLVATTLNAIIVLQFVLYWGSGKPKAAPVKDKKKAKKDD
eukprot:m.148843 g.148843  ORF g.148843 m.148843 type:complete len:251 (-) comp15063_c0_seq1:32-784(-)